MKHTLKDLSITRVALVPAGSNPMADIVLFKSKPSEPPPQSKESGFMKKNIDTSKLNAAELAALETLLNKSATDIVDPAAPPPSEDILKDLPPAVRAIVEKAQTDAADAKRVAETATATATLEKALREEGDFVTANTAMVKAYPGDAAANARLLHRIKKALKPEDYVEAEKLIKAGNAALEQACAALGGDGESTTVSGAKEKLQELAKAIQKEKPGTTFNVAYEEACAANMDLVRQARGQE